MTITDLLNKMQLGQTITVNAEPHIIKSKTEYTITEDQNVRYYKCVLDDHQALVIIPDDELIYIGGVIPNFDYQRISDEEIRYDGQVFQRTGSGHQIVVKIDFGDPEDTEGECDFEDYESDTHIISLGVLQNGERADVFAKKISLDDIQIEEA